MDKAIKKWKVIIALVGAYIGIYAVGNIIELYDENPFLGIGDYVYNIYSVLIAVGNFWLIKRTLERKNKGIHITSALVGAVLSFLLVSAAYIMKYNDIFMSETVFTYVTTVLAFLPVTVPVVEEIFNGLDKLSTCVIESSDLHTNFFVFWAIIFVPYFLVFLSMWPGNFMFDAKYQLMNVNDQYYTTHHPLIHTLMMGIPYQWGVKWGNAALGISFYTLAQILCVSCAYAYAVWYLNKRIRNKKLTVGLLLWFALFPLHPIYAITATKDVMFAAFFVAFVIYQIRYFLDGESFGVGSYVGMILCGVGLVLFRNNGKYALIVALLGTLILVKKNRQRLVALALLISVLVLSSVFNNMLIRYTKATTNDEYRETMSIPLQCLARVASVRENELPEDLYQEITLYISEDTISKYYPFNADPVKNSANEELLEKNILNFLKLCVKVGMRFPGEFTEAFLTNTLGYWKIGEKAYCTEYNIAIAHQLIENGPEIIKQDYCPPVYKIYYWLFGGDMNYLKVPVLSFAMRSDTYLWITILLGIWCIYRRKRTEGIAVLLPIAYLLTCLLGPISFTRYVYCLIVSCPLLFTVCVRKKAEEINQEKMTA